MHYVIGDVHGCYDEMMTLIGKIEAQDDKAEIIFLGDFVDRGKDVWKVLQWAYKNVNRKGTRYKSVMGNHENMIIDWFNELYDDATFLPSAYYHFDYIARNHFKDSSELEPYISWMKAMPFKIDVLDYRIVHAWSSFRNNEASDNIWKRKCEGNFRNDTIIVHGHTPTATEEYYNGSTDRKGMICYRHNAINVDGGAVFNGLEEGLKTHLCGICLETLEEFYNDCDFKGHDDTYRNEMLNRIKL